MQIDHAHQLTLAIDHAPPKVRAHGLRDAHSRPLVSHGKREGVFGSSFRVAPWDAWNFPSIELRAGNSWPVIILDCDGRDATLRLADAYISGRVSWPNWVVTRSSSGGSHGVWCLGKPVHRGERARQSPLNQLARVSEYMAELVGADSGYAGVLTHNPMSRAHGPGLRTTWGRREPYQLGELAEVIPFGWRKPKIPRTDAGRNSAIFESLMRWAGSPANAGIAVLAAANVQNDQYRNHPLGPLDLGELAGIAKSVERYRARWAARGWHRPEWIERQRDRGRAGGLRPKRGKLRASADPDNGTNETLRPWEAEGVSRAWWYRKRSRQIELFPGE